MDGVLPGTTAGWREAVGELSVGPLYGGGFIPAYFQLCLFYYTVGGLLHFVCPRVFPVRDIQAAKAAPSAIARDAFYALGPLAVKAAIWTLVERLHAAGRTLMYEGSMATPTALLYGALCWAVLDVVHDLWFYATHRFLHWKPLFRHVHYIHHKSTSPTAFTGYSFHVVEGVIVFANEVFVALLFPMHAGLHRIYHLATTAVHLGGHAGYEIAPYIPTLPGLLALAARGLRPQPALNTVQHHDMHHRYPTRHFSLYFTHWDRWLGTLHPKYDTQLFSYFPTAT